MEISRLEQLREIARNDKKGTLVVASAADEHVLRSVMQAIQMNIARAILLGDEKKIGEIASSIGFDLSDTEIVHVPDINKTAEIAVKIIHQGQADILVKGQVKTGILLKEVLNNEYGLRKAKTLSHLAIFQTSFYPKLLGVTDAALNIQPSINEKIGIMENAIEVFHRLGILKPKVALLSALEYVNEKIQSSVDASKIVALKPNISEGNYFLDGPLALDNAVSAEAAALKGIKSDVAGDADILVAPTLIRATSYIKACVFCLMASLLQLFAGPLCPSSLHQGQKQWTAGFIQSHWQLFFKINNYGIKTNSGHKPRIDFH